MTESRGIERRDALQWWCRLILQGFAASFAIVGTLFFLFPDGTIRFLNGVGAFLGNFTPAPPSALRFWVSLSIGYMALVTALAYLAQRDLRRRDLLALLALAKGVSSVTCLGYYLFSSDAFVYLANFLVDGTIAVATIAIWLIVPRVTTPAPDAAGAGPTHHPSVGLALNALLEAMVPPGGPFKEGARDTAALRDIEGFAGGLISPRALALIVRMLDLTPFVLPPLRLRRFSRLPLDDRVHLLEAWEQSRLMPRRQVIRLLKLLITSQFYSQPEIAVHLRYPQPLVRVPRNEVA